MKTIAIYPGTFDPFTFGHLDIIKTSYKIFDQTIITICVNIKKTNFLFSVPERISMIEYILKIQNIRHKVKIIFDKGLTTDLAKKFKSSIIIRGVRSSKDFEEELDISFINRNLGNNDLDTILIMPKQEHLHIRSSTIRKLISFNYFDLKNFVPRTILKEIKKKKGIEL